MKGTAVLMLMVTVAALFGGAAEGQQASAKVCDLLFYKPNSPTPKPKDDQ